MIHFILLAFTCKLHQKFISIPKINICRSLCIYIEYYSCFPNNIRTPLSRYRNSITKRVIEFNIQGVKKFDSKLIQVDLGIRQFPFHRHASVQVVCVITLELTCVHYNSLCTIKKKVK